MGLSEIASAVASVVSIGLGAFAIWQASRYNRSTGQMLIEQRAVLVETKDTLQKITVMYEALKAEVATKAGPGFVLAMSHAQNSLSPGAP